MLARALRERQKRSQVVNLSVTEVIFIMLFTVLAFTHYAEREHKDGVTSLEKHVRIIEDKLQKREKRIKRLEGDFAQSRVDLEKERSRYQMLLKILEKQKQTGHISQDTLNKVFDELNLGRAPGAARCSIGGDSEFSLYDVTMYDDAFTIYKAWPENIDSMVQEVSGVTQLQGRGRISIKEFEDLSMMIYLWGDHNKSGKCRFTISVRDETTTKATYKNQLHTVERFYYKRLLD